MPMSWTMGVGGVMPFLPADIIISFAEHQIAIISRNNFFRLAIHNTSESTRRPDWILLSPGNCGQA
eukprot:7961125-Pyramimonas_sp.AAC.1